MKRDRIDLRVRVDQKLYWMESAEKLGMDMSEMIRRATDQFIAIELGNKKDSQLQSV